MVSSRARTRGADTPSTIARERGVVVCLESATRPLWKKWTQSWDNRLVHRDSRSVPQTAA